MTVFIIEWLLRYLGSDKSVQDSYKNLNNSKIMCYVLRDELSSTTLNLCNIGVFCDHAPECT